MPTDHPLPIDRFLPLRPVEFEILLSLAAGDRHGYGIIKDAEERGLSRTPDVGTLYRALRRMTDDGLKPQWTLQIRPLVDTSKPATTPAS